MPEKEPINQITKEQSYQKQREKWNGFQSVQELFDSIENNETYENIFPSWAESDIVIGCMDEGCTECSVKELGEYNDCIFLNLAGSGVLLDKDPKEVAQKLWEGPMKRIRERGGKFRAITAHSGCGAAKIDGLATDNASAKLEVVKDTLNKYIQNENKLNTTDALIPEIEFKMITSENLQRPSHFHDASMCAINLMADRTLRFSSHPELPAAFTLNARKIRNKVYTCVEAIVAMGIAMGNHGLGIKNDTNTSGFTTAEPFKVVTFLNSNESADDSLDKNHDIFGSDEPFNGSMFADPDVIAHMVNNSSYPDFDIYYQIAKEAYENGLITFEKVDTAKYFDKA